MHLTRFAGIRFAALTSIFALAGCAESAPASNEPPVSKTASAIVSGQQSNTDGVGLVYFTTDYVCTGFLVSPNVVVTAAFCFNDGKTPTAFYTGAGAAVTDPSDATDAANLTKYEIASSGKYPGAVTQPAESGGAAYAASNDVAYVVLTTAATEAPIPYSSTQTPGSCTSAGYGRDGAKFGEGALGARRQGTVTLGTTIPDTDAVSVTGANLANSGDFGGPLLCGGSAVALFSAFHYAADHTIDVNAYQPITATIKTWIDGLVAANPVPTATADGGTSSGGTDSGVSTNPTGSSSSSSGGSKSTSGSDSTPTDTTDNSGCSVQSGPTTSSFGFLIAAGLVLAARIRRRKR